MSGGKIEVKRYEAAPRRHSHDHHQIVMALEGQMQMEVEGREGAVSDRQAALVTAGEAHLFGAGDKASFLVADIPISAESQGLWDRAESNAFVELDPGFAALPQFLASESLRYGLRGKALHQASDLLIASFCRRLQITEGAKDCFTKARQVLSAELAQDLPMAFVARSVGLSLSAFHDGFRERFGLSPGRYRQQCRMEEAKRILIESDCPLATIALDLGFSEQSAFSRAFKQATGMSPLRYRSDSRSKKLEIGSRPDD